MAELRLNTVTNEWVIMASRRGDRPHELRREPAHPPLPARSETCPFCPGNEEESTRETFRHPPDPESEWSVRVVLNKFPALTAGEGPPELSRNGLEVAVNGYGCHEVIIETPRHDRMLALRSVEEVRAMLEVYRARYVHHAQNPSIAQVIIFKNHGERAGTSIIHPHSQLIALPVVPPQVQQRVWILNEYWEQSGGCLICKMIEQERDDGRRILCEGRHFVAFIPYAALSRYHTWIMPTRHESAFGDTTADELFDLATTLRRVLRMLHDGLGDPAFNYMIRSAPVGNFDFHWYLAIVPRVTQAAGFELGSGMYINPSLPEESAAFLRSVATRSSGGD